MQPKATCPAPTDGSAVAAQKYCGMKELFTLSH